MGQKKKAASNRITLAVEVTALLLVFAALVCFLSLVSFSPEDPTFFNSGTVSRMMSNNIMGNFGAQASAFLLTLFGYAAYLFPIFFTITAIMLLKSRSFGPLFKQLPFFLVETVVFAVLFAVLLKDFVMIASTTPLAWESAGGVIGTNLKGLMLPAFNAWGTVLILLFIMIACFMLGTRLGVSVIVTTLAALVVQGGKGFASVMRSLRGEMGTMKKKRRVIRQIDDEKKLKQRMREKVKSGELPPISRSVKEETDDGKSPLDIAVDAGLDTRKPEDYNPPWRQIFADPDVDTSIDRKELSRKAEQLVKKMEEFNVTGRVVNIHPGPIVTTYEFQMDPGIKFNKVLGLSQDLGIALSAESVRIARMFRKPTIGIEVPNEKRKLIVLKEILDTKEFLGSSSPLTITLGKTITGEPYVTQLDKMPHLLVAGQTGSGKSVGVNGMLCSLLVRNSPQQLKLILVDPKMVELGIYSHIPHLLTDVITDPKEAASALSWAVSEMERRYKLLKALRVRSLAKYNAVVASEMTDEDHEQLPHICVVIDEMADLIMVARAQVEENIARLAQKARAVGLHLIVATQRPSRDIVTGVIKSNLTSRICYRVAQMIDSRIILDQVGGEQLLGRGDMLFLPPGSSNLVRIHSPFITEKEINALVDYLKDYDRPTYLDGITEFGADEDGERVTFEDGGGLASGDPEYVQAVKLIIATGQASVSYLQRKLSIGYNKAARYIDMMEDDGIVGPPARQSGKPRDVLVDIEFLQRLEEMDE